MPRFDATFAFDSQSLAESQNFARSLRRAWVDARPDDWAEANAKLLKVKQEGDGRQKAVVRFDASDLPDARDFGRILRGVAREDQGTRYDYESRNAKLLKLRDQNADTD